MAERKPKTPEGSGDTNPNPQASSAQTPAYLAAALRLSTSYPLGARPTDNAVVNSGIVDTTDELKPVPGYMVLNYFPTLGVSTSNTSAVNRASYNEFNAIRSQISGTRPYAPSDLMIYRACVDGLRDLYYVVRRIYGTIRKYSATNLYRPTAALTAMGLNAENWINHAADLYQWMHTHRNALAPFPTVPIGSISKRREVYNTYMYTDGAIDSVQTYILNQNAFWSYEAVDEVRGITTRMMPETYEDFVTMWDEMYTALQQSADVYIIAADIRRAFPDKYETELPIVPEDYIVEYIELDPIKCAIMNAFILGEDITTGGTARDIVSAFRIYDDSGVIICDPTFRRELDVHEGAHSMVTAMLNHINSVEADPSAESILNDMRFKVVVHQSVDSERGLTTHIISMGTEVIYSACMVGFNADGGIEYIPLSTWNLFHIGNGSNAEWYSATDLQSRLVAALVNFDWHPPVITSYVANSGGGTISIIEDVQNYIPVSDDNISQIHEASLLAQFGF